MRPRQPSREPGPRPGADRPPRARRLFGVKCAQCRVGFSSSDLVMRARDSVYHIECFRCSVCSRQLLPGDEFSLREHELLCRADHGLLLERAGAGSPRSPGPLPARGLHLPGERIRARARFPCAGLAPGRKVVARVFLCPRDCEPRPVCARGNRLRVCGSQDGVVRACGAGGLWRAVSP